jgi:protein-S-isoprenylcysteine O-methyltransferase Ste14
MTRTEDSHPREIPPSTRLLAIVVGASFFGVGLPWLLAAAGRRADQAAELPQLTPGGGASLLGAVLITIGLFFAGWSVRQLFSVGRGTPLPFLPAPRLVVRPPYSYCRNPMAFGVILAYIGFGFAIGSVGAVGYAMLFAGFLVVYIKFEEAGLRARFGEDYLEYKRRTPFLIPRPWL